LGVTDSQGKLWRELGECSWDVPPCVGWLPPQVDVSSLPPGQPKSVQLDPISYEPTDDPQYFVYPDETHFQIRCVDSVRRQMINKVTQAVEYSLRDDRRTCPLSPDLGDEGVPVIVAYDPKHQLLATYTGHFGDNFVSIWKMCTDTVGALLTRLNSSGVQMEFAPDGHQLRARNPNAWKIYDVDDILLSATADCESATS
jgi:hypothetical protein